MNTIQKNTIYLVNGRDKMVCILSDKEFACLCPISFHSKDNGYKINFNSVEIHSQQVCVAEIKSIGVIRNGEARTFLGVPMKLKRTKSTTL